jgi:hypothetical protein
MQESQHGVDQHQTLEMSSRDIQAYNKSNNHKETQGFVTGVQPHTLRSTSPLRNPQRVDLYTYVTFLPLATTKIKLELLTQFRGDTNLLGQP